MWLRKFRVIQLIGIIVYLCFSSNQCNAEEWPLSPPAGGANLPFDEERIVNKLIDATRFTVRRNSQTGKPYISKLSLELEASGLKTELSLKNFIVTVFEDPSRPHAFAENKEHKFLLIRKNHGTTKELVNTDPLSSIVITVPAKGEGAAYISHMNRRFPYDAIPKTDDTVTTEGNTISFSLSGDQKVKGGKVNVVANGTFTFDKYGNPKLTKLKGAQYTTEFANNENHPSIVKAFDEKDVYTFNIGTVIGKTDRPGFNITLHDLPGRPRIHLNAALLDNRTGKAKLDVHANRNDINLIGSINMHGLDREPQLFATHNQMVGQVMAKLEHLLYEKPKSTTWAPHVEPSETDFLFSPETEIFIDDPTVNKNGEYKMKIGFTHPKNKGEPLYIDAVLDRNGRFSRWAKSEKTIWKDIEIYANGIPAKAKGSRQMRLLFMHNLKEIASQFPDRSKNRISNNRLQVIADEPIHSITLVDVKPKGPTTEGKSNDFTPNGVIDYLQIQPFVTRMSVGDQRVSFNNIGERSYARSNGEGLHNPDTDFHPKGGYYGTGVARVENATKCDFRRVAMSK